MGTKVDYLEKRWQSAEYCGVVTDLITRSGPSTRTNIDDALAPYLPAAQRRNWDDGPLRASDMREEGAAKSEKVEGQRSRRSHFVWSKNARIVSCAQLNNCFTLRKTVVQKHEKRDENARWQHLARA